MNCNIDLPCSLIQNKIADRDIKIFTYMALHPSLPCAYINIHPHMHIYNQMDDLNKKVIEK